MKSIMLGAGRFFVLALLIFIATPAHAQWPKDTVVDQLVQTGIDQIYNFAFDSAEETFAQVKKLRPDHPVGYFFRAMIEWERISCNFDDDSQDDKFYAMLDSVEDICDKLLKENPNDITALFFKGGAVGFAGRLRANRGKWLGAANDGMVALPLVRKAYALEPDNYDILLGIGIYNYYASVIPERYPIVKPIMLFFPGGDRKKGLEQLKLAAEHAKYAQVEAAYFLVQNYFMYEKEYGKALEIAKKLHERYPNNSIFHRYYGRCLVSTGHLGEANDVFTDILKRYEKKQFGYDMYDFREAQYYLGKFEFIAGRDNTALQYLFKCDELSRTLDKDGASGFMSLANLYIGMIYDNQGQRQLAVKEYEKVLDMKEYENSRADAKKYLDKPFSRTK